MAIIAQPRFVLMMILFSWKCQPQWSYKIVLIKKKSVLGVLEPARSIQMLCGQEACTFTAGTLYCQNKQKIGNVGTSKIKILSRVYIYKGRGKICGYLECPRKWFPVTFWPFQIKPLCSGHLSIADTKPRTRECPLQTGMTVLKKYSWDSLGTSQSLSASCSRSNFSRILFHFCIINLKVGKK